MHTLLRPSPASASGVAQPPSAAENDSRHFQAGESPIDHAADLILREASLFTISRDRAAMSACQDAHAQKRARLGDTLARVLLS